MSAITDDTIVTLWIDGQSKDFTWLSLTQQLTSDTSSDIASSMALDVFWTLISAVIVLLFVVGFMFLEIGCVSPNNTAPIISKSLAVLCASIVSFYTLGHALSSDSGDAFSGDSGFFLTGSAFDSVDMKIENGISMVTWLYQWTTIAAIVGIIGGSMAERTHVYASLGYSILISSISYPLLYHWTQTTAGWASATHFANRFLDVGLIDFGGGGILSVSAGVFALVGCIALGPRKERASDTSFAPLCRQSDAMQTIGTLLIWIGFYGLSCGSTLSLGGNSSATVARVAVNLTISGAFGGLFCFMYSRLLSRYGCPIVMNNGILAALVAITPGCSTVETYSAVAIGIVAVVLYLLASNVLQKLRIDDVTEASAIFLLPGIWGLLAAGLFSTPELYTAVYNVSAEDVSCGAFYVCRGRGGQQLAVNLIIALITIAWNLVFALVVFNILKIAKLLVIEESTAPKTEPAETTRTTEDGREYHHIDIPDDENKERIISPISPQDVFFQAMSSPKGREYNTNIPRLSTIIPSITSTMDNENPYLSSLSENSTIELPPWEDDRIPPSSPRLPLWRGSGSTADLNDSEIYDGSIRDSHESLDI